MSESSKAVGNSTVQKDDCQYHLHRWLYFSERLAEQCDGWLSAEEGDRNIEKRIREWKVEKTKT